MSAAASFSQRGRPPPPPPSPRGCEERDPCLIHSGAVSYRRCLIPMAVVIAQYSNHTVAFSPGSRKKSPFTVLVGSLRPAIISRKHAPESYEGPPTPIGLLAWLSRPRAFLAAEGTQPHGPQCFKHSSTFAGFGGDFRISNAIPQISTGWFFLSIFSQGIKTELLVRVSDAVTTGHVRGSHIQIRPTLQPHGALIFPSTTPGIGEALAPVHRPPRRGPEQRSASEPMVLHQSDARGQRYHRLYHKPPPPPRREEKRGPGSTPFCHLRQHRHPLRRITLQDGTSVFR